MKPWTKERHEAARRWALLSPEGITIQQVRELLHDVPDACTEIERLQAAAEAAEQQGQRVLSEALANAHVLGEALEDAMASGRPPLTTAEALAWARIVLRETWAGEDTHDGTPVAPIATALLAAHRGTIPEEVRPKAPTERPAPEHDGDAA